MINTWLNDKILIILGAGDTTLFELFIQWIEIKKMLLTQIVIFKWFELFGLWINKILTAQMLI